MPELLSKDVRARYNEETRGWEAVLTKRDVLSLKASFLRDDNYTESQLCKSQLRNVFLYLAVNENTREKKIDNFVCY